MRGQERVGSGGDRERVLDETVGEGGNVDDEEEWEEDEEPENEGGGGTARREDEATGCCGSGMTLCGPEEMAEER